MLPLAAVRDFDAELTPVSADFYFGHGACASTSSDMGIGSLERGDGDAPILKTDVWMSDIPDAEDHVKRALLDEVLNRAQANGAAVTGATGAPTLH